MKALSIRQPYLDRILSGHKKYELRSWKTNHRGNILLCSAKKIDEHSVNFCKNKEYKTGFALAVVELMDIFEYKLEHKYDADHHFLANYFCWKFENIKILDNPFPVIGKMGLFEIDF